METAFSLKYALLIAWLRISPHWWEGKVEDTILIKITDGVWKTLVNCASYPLLFPLTHHSVFLARRFNPRRSINMPPILPSSNTQAGVYVNRRHIVDLLSHLIVKLNCIYIILNFVYSITQLKWPFNREKWNISCWDLKGLNIFLSAMNCKDEIRQMKNLDLMWKSSQRRNEIFIPFIYKDLDKKGYML